MAGSQPGYEFGFKCADVNERRVAGTVPTAVGADVIAIGLGLMLPGNPFALAPHSEHSEAAESGRRVIRDGAALARCHPGLVDGDGGCLHTS